ncbi:uncharacterized protein Dana_GF23270 [Drosophila ananassae]|uniref:Uncharacterized protein n=1 Tax=Drosophila ananassae TaxID=7217 RepID=B3MT14_DROAN|nr:uncharacterized protein LOC6505913 [Drosophila ananassae]EDV30404.1 uncharacterized protein Dana_GF23270 [Drosophila ananassae]
MLRRLSVYMFNTAEIESNLFAMADDVYGTIEIFKDAAKFESQFARPFEMISALFDCVVFMAVAVMVIGFTMHSRIVKFRKLSRQSYHQKRTTVDGSPQGQTRLAFNTYLRVKNNDDAEDISSTKEDETSLNNSRMNTADEDTATLQPLDAENEAVVTPVGHTNWGMHWFTILRIKGIGTIYDSLFQ